MQARRMGMGIQFGAVRGAAAESQGVNTLFQDGNSGASPGMDA
jgi:hypothetical protein